MASRHQLQLFLEELLGSSNVYFQPPASVRMKYPAIKFTLNGIDNEHANDGVYIQNKSYSLTLIDPNPDSAMIDKISSLPNCRFDRHYKSDNLNHYTFTLYY